ncbi:MAG TPA: protein kinase [Thermoanaerobaculia bacterium]|nr:protein kinase [Thermoanaerobaculia bacterium]
MPDTFPTVLSRYRVLSLLGAGGMGEVYLASDDRLGRRVAIKILPEAVGRDEEAKLRMLREARAVATLDHPNVCTIYEVGEHDDGRPYIVMQFVEGETLFDRLRQARMSPSEVLDVAMQVAAALDEAHSHGIIHRDVKPMNVMLTPRGQVKVLDFGLAKFTAARDTSVTDHLESRAGIITGTAPYMSPEQLRGAPIDARSDIFSLGVVLYEMVTGRRPFERTSTVATITAILFEDPDPIDEPGFSAFVPIIRRALAKEPSKRYSTAAQLLDALNDIKARPKSSPPRTRSAELEPTERNVARASARGARPEGRPASSRSGRIDSLAVLPSMHGKVEASLEYLVYGLSEGIVNALAQVKKLRVIAPGTAAQYAGSDPDPREAGRELNVAGIVIVRARVEGDVLHADVDLVSTSDGSLLWSSQYTRPVREIATLAESIADGIAERVRGTASAARRPVKKKRAIDAEAEQLHLKGRFQWIKRHPEAVKQAMTLFQQAVERDPSFALPYAGLADCFVMLGFMHALPPREILPKVKAAAKRAIELDPTLADPHATLGYAAGLFEWDYDTAQRELEEAMRLNPNYPWAPHWLGILMCSRGQLRRAYELIDMSKELDPLSPILNVGAGIPLHIAGRYDDAVNCYRAVLETDPALAPGHYYLGMSLEMRGDYEDATREMERAIEIAGPAPIFLGALAHVLARSGRRDDALRLIDQLRAMARQRYVSPYSFAVAHTGLDDVDAALDALRESLEEHNAWMCFVPIDPRFDTLRDDPRFGELLGRYGLPARVERDG